MGARAFFRSGGGPDLIGLCIDLGLIFKCSPMAFMDEPRQVILELCNRTQERMKDMEDLPDE